MNVSRHLLCKLIVKQILIAFFGLTSALEEQTKRKSRGILSLTQKSNLVQGGWFDPHIPDARQGENARQLLSCKECSKLLQQNPGSLSSNCPVCKQPFAEFNSFFCCVTPKHMKHAICEACGMKARADLMQKQAKAPEPDTKAAEVPKKKEDQPQPIPRNPEIRTKAVIVEPRESVKQYLDKKEGPSGPTDKPIPISSLVKPKRRSELTPKALISSAR